MLLAEELSTQPCEPTTSIRRARKREFRRRPGRSELCTAVQLQVGTVGVAIFRRTTLKYCRIIAGMAWYPSSCIWIFDRLIEFVHSLRLLDLPRNSATRAAIGLNAETLESRLCLAVLRCFGLTHPIGGTVE